MYKIPTFTVALALFGMTGTAFLTPDQAHAFGRGKRKQLEADYAEEMRENEELRRKQREADERRRIEKQKQDAALMELEIWLGKIPTGEFMWDRKRCEEKEWNDSLDTKKAEGRFAWTLKCLDEKREETKQIEDPVIRIAKTTYYQLLINTLRRERTIKGSRNTPMYPTFGKPANPLGGTLPVNPEGYVAPTDPAQPCDIPEGYTVVALCESSCFPPDQRILFSSGYEAIGSAKSQNLKSIVALTLDEKSQRFSWGQGEVTHFISSIVPGHHEILDIETESGVQLSVTTNHPMLKAEGVMVAAEALAEGDFLLAPTGLVDPVRSIKGRSYYGKVYNIRLASEDPIENVIVANGLLTGTSFFQNEGKSLLNRRLFRLNLPDELIQLDARY